MNTNSALEDSAQQAKFWLRGWVYSHDRYVVIALLASFIPIPPASVVALLISLANLILIRLGRLRASEARYVWMAIGLAMLGLTAFFLIFQFAQSYFQELLHWVRDVAGNFLGMTFFDFGNRHQGSHINT